MACGAGHASGARITTPPTRRLSLTKKGTRWHRHAHAAALYRWPIGTRPRGGRAAPIVNIFKGAKFMLIAIAVFLLLWLIVDLFNGN